jgi:hypothetical protein
MARREPTTDKDLSPKKSGTTPQSSDMINERSNNMNSDTDLSREVNVERANDAGIGDSGQNDERLTNYTGNRSADA